MSGYLECIIVNNFKSYKGEITIPFSRFTAVIGPNGSGKSNLMDAISFVLGEKTTSLRVKRMSDLIHGASVRKPVSSQASVTAVYRDDNGNKTEFTRIIKEDTADYKINKKRVSKSDYNKELEKINIFVKAKNFLVFQGQVESIAMKNAKERTAIFEEISGSGQFKEEYNRLKAEMNENEVQQLSCFLKKKTFAAERKEAKCDLKEADKYQKLCDEFDEVRTQALLFRLFHTNQRIAEVMEEIQNKHDEVAELESERNNLDDDVKAKKRKVGNVLRQKSAIQKKVDAKEKEINKMKPLYIKAKENTKFSLKKIETTKKSLQQAIKGRSNQEKILEELEIQLSDVESKRQDYENTILQESVSRGGDLELEASQLDGYNRLKEEVAKQSTPVDAAIDNLKRSQQSDQEKFDVERFKKLELEARYQQLQKELAEANSRTTNLDEFITTNSNKLATLRERSHELNEKVTTADRRIEEIGTELVEVSKELGNISLERNESAKEKERQETLEILQQTFPGVHGRVIDMCKPRHPRYRIAITKVLGKDMRSIVCDTKSTAMKCIELMKERRLQTEKFLPLDYIDVSPINEALREIQSPAGVHLLLDVVTVTDPIVRKALQWAVGNTLVCETSDDARKVAFGDNVRRKAVSLDGTLFQKSGIISGGQANLTKKAGQWNEKAVTKLRSKKETLTKELREETKNRRQRAELQDIEIMIRGMESRVKAAQNDVGVVEQNIVAAIRQKIAAVQEQLECIEPRMNEIKERMNQRAAEIDCHQEEINKIADQVFRSFCQSLGIENIRVYEESSLQQHDETMKKRLEFSNHISRLENQLAYEKSSRAADNVDKWEQIIKNEEKHLESLKDEERKLIEGIQSLEADRDVIREEKGAKQAEADQMNAEIEQVRKTIAAANRKMTDCKKAMSQKELKLENYREERHEVYQQSIIDGLKFTFVNQEDSIEELSQLMLSQDTSLIYDRESQLMVDFSALPNELQRINAKRFDAELTKLKEKIDEQAQILMSTKPPSGKGQGHLEQAQTRYDTYKSQFDGLRNKTKQAKEQFEDVKKRRGQHFNECFDFVAEKIDGIYKQLCHNNGAQAYLHPENGEEPYLDGITFNCVAPGKRFCSMDMLSGGEKTLAALSLLFAIHAYQPSPFLVLDEVDAALDNTNISKVVQHIRNVTNRVQCIVISLKEELFNKSLSLVGVYSKQGGDCIASQVLSLDLSPYPEGPDEEDEPDM